MSSRDKILGAVWELFPEKPDVRFDLTNRIQFVSDEYLDHIADKMTGSFWKDRQLLTEIKKTPPLP